MSRWRRRIIATPSQLLAPGAELLGSTLIAGRDTLQLDQVRFTASSDSLDATTAPATLTLQGPSRGTRST